MPGPDDPAEQAKMNLIDVPYYENEEDEDSRETRRSIRTAERMLKRRFKLQEGDQETFEDDIMNGHIFTKDLLRAGIK